MTAASPAGTPLILVVLSLGISFLAAVGSIAAVLMTRANVRWQIQVAAREAWMRELREQVATIMAHYVTVQVVDSHVRHMDTDEPATKDVIARISEISRCAHVIRLLIRERGSQDEEFVQVVNTLLKRVWARRAEPDEPEMEAFATGATAILQRERAAIEAPGKWRNGRGAFGWPPWSRLRTWACGRPHFPT
jgi:hypothetical protein